MSQRPCENCGSDKEFIHANKGQRYKYALTTVIIKGTNAEKSKFQPDAGIPVDVYACRDCGFLRLFGAINSFSVS